MEPKKSSSITMVFLLLLLLLLAIPYVSIGRSLDAASGSEVYEIDYRGPETHSSTNPPPGHFRGRPWFHRGSTHASSKSRGSHGRENTRKIHG